MERNSAVVRERLSEPRAFRYGESPIETIFYYPAKLAHAPLHVHVHGGAWRQRKAEGLLFPAEAFVDAGIGFAIFDFVSVDETDGDLRPMLAQVCAALAWLAEHARELGGDPDRLYLSGFSSGAQLASAAIVADWRRYGFATIPYKGAVLASGMYDLRAVRLSKRSEYVAFTDEVEETMSAQRHVHEIELPLILMHGSHETPEFQRQTRDFAAALGKAGKSARYVLAEGYNHYEMMESLGNPYGPFGRAAISQTREVP
ncbi:MAG: alpha/beta hydrolase [Candidatus Binatia bacterium]